MPKRKKGTLPSPFLRRVYLPDNASIGDEYPFTVPFLKQRHFDLKFERPVTIIVGENATGKSTILESIAYHCGFNVSGGNKNHIYNQKADIAPLSEVLRFSWLPKVTTGFFMRAESFINFAGYIDDLAEEEGRFVFSAYGGNSLNEQSHGEAFLSLFENRFGKPGMYLLDEPEAALSPSRQFMLLAVLHNLERSQNAQIIMATHSPILMSYPRAQLFHISDGEIAEKNYKDTEHFQLMRRFLENPEKYLEDIFSED